MREFIAGISAAFVSLLGAGAPATSGVSPYNYPASAIVAPAKPMQTAAVFSASHGVLYVPQRVAVADTSNSAPSESAEPVVQYVTQPVIERTVQTVVADASAVDEKLSALRNEMVARMNAWTPAVSFSGPPAFTPVSVAAFAPSQKIDQLANVTITNATVDGVTGLTDDDIPNDVTASNYLPLSGGTVTGDFTLTGNFSLSGTQTLSGALTVPYIEATSSTASSFLQASTTRFSVFDKAYFGGTATSTFDSRGSLALVGSLSVSTTTATSTISTGGFTVGGSQFVVQQESGNVGIGTTSPSHLLEIQSASTNARANVRTFGSGSLAGYFLQNTNRAWQLAVGNSLNGLTAGDGTFSISDQSAIAARFVINTSGNVGIGTTTPDNKLTIAATPSDASGTGALSITDGSARAFALRLSAGGIANFNLDRQYSGTWSTALTVLRENGNVGIGTTTPSTNLSIFAANSPILALDQSNTGGLASIQFNENSATKAFIKYRGTTNTPANQIQVGTNSSGGTLALQTGSASTALYIDSSGNVGIGTTTPGAKLEINGGTGAINALLSNNGYLEWRSSTGATGQIGIYGLTNNGLAFYTGANNRLTISSSGNVGIGTTSPWTNLGVVSTNSVIADFQRNGAGGGAGIQITNGDGQAGRIFYQALTNEGFRFDTRTTSNAVVIANSGNVGIGTTSPEDKLHVAGNVVLDNNFALMANNTAGTNINLVGLNSSNNITVGANISGIGLMDIYGGATGPIRLNTGGSIRLQVASTGNIGVATTSPWRTLSVTGTVGFDGLTGSTGAGSLCLTANKEIVYNSGSDACLPSLRDTKRDISLLSLDALQIVDALDPVSFVYNDGDGRTRYGFIAEDTAAVDSHLVTYSASGTLSGIDDRSIISVVVKALQELASRISAFADHFTTNELTFNRATGDQLCLKKSDGTPVCVTGDQLAAAISGTTAASGASVDSAPVAADTEPPVITINGNNPATLRVGDTYSDLGATVTDNVDLNLGYEIFVGSTPLEQAHIDTSEPNEWHIHYVATDNAGNAATSTRTVIVESPSIIPAEGPESEAAEEPEPEEELVAS